jgi:predicted aspartyl protease
MPTLDHLVARRITRQDAVRLIGASPLLAHEALAAGPTALRAPQSPLPTTTAAADRLFEAGQFVAADAAYRQILAHDPHNVHALAQRGYIALLSNRLAQAQALLTKSLTLAPGNRQARGLLVLTLYRADAFAQLAALYRKLGSQAPLPLPAQLLESFQGRTPYDIQGPATSRIPFLQTDPLLLIDVSVNGLEPVPFVVDTGAATIGLVPELARRAGVRLVGTIRAMGVGGKPITVHSARVDRVRLGDFEIRNVPGSTGGNIATGVRAPDGRPVQGNIGTIVLSHFLCTLDYVGAALILRRKTAALLRPFEAEARAASAAVMPFWIYTDHLIEALGTVNGHGPLLFTVDTGSNADFGSKGFFPSWATVKEAGIRVDRSKAYQFHGSGGAFTAYPIQLKEVTLGSVVRRNLPGAANVIQGPVVEGPRPGSSGATHVVQGPQPGSSAAIEPRIGGSVSGAFFRPFSLTIDTVGMRLFVARGRTAA